MHLNCMILLLLCVDFTRLFFNRMFVKTFIPTFLQLFLNFFANFASKSGTCRSAAKIASSEVSFSYGCKAGPLNDGSLLIHVHVPEHHDGRQQESSGVGLVQASDVRRRAVHRLEHGATEADVAAGRETQP